MGKKPLIGASICAVVLLVLGSLSNVVGYQAVQTSRQNIIKERINQRELLFQTIVDMANNKEIQRVILKSQMTKGKFLNTDATLPTPITKHQLRQMYFIGLLLSKVISKSKIHSMVERYQVNNQGVQKEISVVIEENDTLNKEMNQLMDIQCDCEKNNLAPPTRTIVCALLDPINFVLDFLKLVSYICAFLYDMLDIIGMILGCPWAPGVPE